MPWSKQSVTTQGKQHHERDIFFQTRQNCQKKIEVLEQQKRHPKETQVEESISAITNLIQNIDNEVDSTKECEERVKKLFNYSQCDQ